MKVKSSHPSATHHCYAWRMGLVRHMESFQDDGEPSGTAGQPILNQMRSFNLINAGVIVVRYYGGTKLGKTGLIEAYGYSTELVIKSSRLKTLYPTDIFEIRYSYEYQNLIEIWKNRYNLIEKNAEYLEDVTVTFACPSGNSDSFRRQMHQNAHILTSFEESGPSFELSD